MSSIEHLVTMMSPDELGLIQRYRMYSYMHMYQKVFKIERLRNVQRHKIQEA